MSTVENDDPIRVRTAAEAARGRFVDDPLALSAQVADPIPVQSPAGGLDSWFVGLTVEDRLVGFFQLEPNLHVHRYASFQRRRGSADGCPPAATWIDRAEIAARARRARPGDGQLGDPVLSFDGSRDRLAWRVTVPGSTMSIYVAGEHVYTKDS